MRTDTGHADGTAGPERPESLVLATTEQSRMGVDELGRLHGPPRGDPALTDLASFLGCTLSVRDRREHYDVLLRAFHEELRRSHDDELRAHPERRTTVERKMARRLRRCRTGIGRLVPGRLTGNQRQPLVRALLCGADMPPVAVDALVPADPWEVRTDTVELDHSPSAALQPSRVCVRARAQAYDDPAARLRGVPGIPVELTMHLVWATDVRGQAPVRLVSPDRRGTEVPRVRVAVAAADGRRGVGWVARNRNVATR